MSGVFGDSTFNFTNASSIKLYDEPLLAQIVIVGPKVVCRSEGFCENNDHRYRGVHATGRNIVFNRDKSNRVDLEGMPGGTLLSGDS
jgi:hypothetical protein